MPHITTCSRCPRAVQDEIPDDWEVIEDEDGQPHEVCPDCVTPAERQAFDEDAMDMVVEMTNPKEEWLTFIAERQGLQLGKSPQPDPAAVDYGTYGISHVQTNGLVAGDRTG
ncbi:hypothetical protein SAMN05660209_03588 [Geodermatophilus africanus]|uniref:Uncharacterized protein n=1 Tax=Geodermatophilus africanus TaxID=1137993 RepID=A0A1H3M7J4_9ACTN|nr:hypothetical protein [Geodermatophilus africanus]SDY72692.1 hypothetical protein SAMN05660209_03588 [Geodermatophilus africanus]